MIPSFSLLGSLHILQQQTNHHAPLPLRHSIHRSKTPHPTDLHAVQVPLETVLSLSHSCKLSPIVRGHISDVNRRVNGYGRHHSPTIRFRLHTCLEVEGLSLSILPPPAHSTMPCGISPETPNDTELNATLPMPILISNAIGVEGERDMGFSAVCLGI